MNSLDAEKVAAFQFDGGPVGCLLLHGFTSSPFVMRELGEYLAEQGLSVLCRTLPGHGTTAADLIETDWHDWFRASVDNLAELSGRCEKVVICGISMGGALGLHLAAHYAREYNVAGVVSYAAPVYMKHPLLPFLPVMKLFMKYKRTPEKDIADPVARAEAENYDCVPLRSVASVMELCAHLKHDLQDVTVPALLFQSINDNTVHPPNVYVIRRLLGSADKTVIELEKSWHVLTVDYDKEVVKEKTLEFVRRVAGISP